MKKILEQCKILTDRTKECCKKLTDRTVECCQIFADGTKKCVKSAQDTKICKICVEHKKKCVSCSIVTILAIIALSYLYQAGFSASVDGTATAEILANLTIVQNVEMDFGRIAPDTAPQTVTIANGADTATCSGGAVCTGSALRGVFTITGANEPINISYTNGSLSDGVSTAIPLNVSSAGNITSTTISGGTYTLYVGGILSVGTSQPAGTYDTTNGSVYNVIVDY